VARKKRLNTSRSVAQHLANVTHQLQQDEITIGKAKALTYISSVLLKAIENSDFEERLEKLEDKLNKDI
jgi:hypothetical protein